MHLPTHIWSGRFRHGSVVGLVSQLGQSDMIALVVHSGFCEIDPFLAVPPFIGQIEKEGAKRTWVLRAVMMFCAVTVPAPKTLIFLTGERC